MCLFSYARMDIGLRSDVSPPLLLRFFIKHSHVWISELGVSCLRFAFLEVDFWNVSCSVCLRLSHQLG